MIFWKLATVTVLSVCITAAQYSCNSSTQYLLHGRCCDMCPPGHRIVARCAAESPTLCEPCPAGTYSSDYSNFRSCAHCQFCNKALRHVKRASCTPTKNERCECETTGSYEARTATGSTLFWCCPHCPAGQQLVNKCEFTDFITSCAPCPPGTFSNGNGSPCRNHTRCDAVTSPPTNSTDAVCADKPVYADNIAAWTGISLVIIMISFGLFIRCCQQVSELQGHSDNRMGKICCRASTE